MSIAVFALLVSGGMAVNAAEDGKAVYEASCSRCHDSGKMGAPMLDDMSEWTDRTQILWSDVHEQHVDDGLLDTPEDDPEKGISAAQMEAATNYMVSIVHKK